METINQWISPEDARHLERLAEAERANEYLYRVLDIGQTMLQSGAEVSRVEDSIRRLCVSFGAERADVFAITSNITVTIYSNSFGALTQTRRVGGQQYDLHRLSLFFGGSARDAVASGIVGIVLKCLDMLIRRTQANAFLSALLCSCLGGLLAALAVRTGLGDNVDMISIGNIMLLIPGIALTNSLRDMFSGNTISGMMRFIEAILLALVIACGFALVAGLL